MQKKVYTSPDMEIVNYTLRDVLAVSFEQPTTDPEIGSRIGYDPDDPIEF